MNSTAGKGKVGHIEIGPSLSDLPDSVLVIILLKLTVKRIFVCKCVCKTWYDLISDPDFAKLHFNQSQFYPLLRSTGIPLLSRMVCLVQPEQDDFERTLEMSSDRSPINIKTDCKLKLPLRNIEKILGEEEDVESKNHMKLYMMNHVYYIVNSCNGLLFLSNRLENDHVIVCNPVTGEFIDLPKTIDNDAKVFLYWCAFGFSPATNQYKVIRMVNCRSELKRVTMVEVHTLGTETWRVLRILPKSTWVRFHTYVNGCVYWLSLGLPCYVTCFDIEKECFESISIPPLDCYKDIVRMGVLGGELCISTGYPDVCFWVMKNNSAMKSWSQIYPFLVDADERLPLGTYQPIKYLNNGALLMFNLSQSAFICKDTRKTGFKYLKVTAGFDVIPHIPSFVPLKHALSGNIVKVLHVKSRCAELKLQEEDKDISIVEEDFDRKRRHV